MNAATLSMCTEQVLKDIMDKKGWYGDASDSKKTLVGKLTEPRGQDVKVSIAAVLQSDSVNRCNTSKCGKYLSVEHTTHEW